MTSFLLRRLAISVVVLVGITIISFFIINLAPGGQVALPGSELNPSFTPQLREQMRRQFHFDEPLYVQYVLMMRDMFTGRLTSFADGQSAVGKVLRRAPATMALSAMASSSRSVARCRWGFTRPCGAAGGRTGRSA